MNRTEEILRAADEALARTKFNAHDTQSIGETRKDPVAQQPVAYYDSETEKYYSQNSRGEWIKTTEGSLKRYLRRVTYAQITKNEGQDNRIDDHLIDLQRNLDVVLAVPIAGLPIGLHVLHGNRILVTRQANYVKPRKGPWPKLQAIIQELLPNQTDMLYAWLKSRLETLREGYPFRPGQILMIAGPRGCGKSFLQNTFTDLFGGRKAEPYKVMIGTRDHNSQLFKGEHQMIEDKATLTDTKSRRAFGGAIKEMLVNETQEYHRKHGEPCILCPFWATTLTVNDEPENLMVIPPIDDSLEDKIILLLASKATFPFRDDDLKARKAFREAVTAELPAFVSFLLSWKMPQHLRDQRYGCKSWQHPELLESLNALAPQTALLELIDELRPFDSDSLPFEGTARKLEGLLLSKDKTGRVARLLYYTSCCGTYLSRLAGNASTSGRVSEIKKFGNKSIWRIVPAEAMDTIPN